MTSWAPAEPRLADVPRRGPKKKKYRNAHAATPPATAAIRSLESHAFRAASRRLFATTDTDENAIAAAAIMGERSQPVAG